MGLQSVMTHKKGLLPQWSLGYGKTLTSFFSVALTEKLTPIGKGGKNEKGILALLDCVPVYLYTYAKRTTSQSEQNLCCVHTD